MPSLPDKILGALLCEEIRQAWSDLDIPYLGPEWRNNPELAGEFDYFANKSWEEIDLEDWHLGTEWFHWVPEETQIYFIAAFLYYCTNVEARPGKDDMLYNGAVFALQQIDIDDSQILEQRRDCIREVLLFIDSHYNYYGFAQPFDYLFEEMVRWRVLN